MKTGMTAFLYSMPAFLIPFLFVYGPGLLLEGDLTSILHTFATSALGIVAFATVTVGWFLADLNPWQRGLIAIGALTLVIPGVLTDVIGMAIIGLVLVQVIVTTRRRKLTRSMQECA